MTRRQESRNARAFRVDGVVQGVGFRWFVQREAVDVGVRGYVKNLRDGAVEVYAIGTAQQLDDMRSRLHSGPGRVLSVSESPAPLREYDTFRIEH
jgi:acylphosphatase